MSLGWEMKGENWRKNYENRKEEKVSREEEIEKKILKVVKKLEWNEEKRSLKLSDEEKVYI
ncbi:hypothetical protein [Staphylococcus epidermidis]|uniref:hypothetical protein n=1 Tax=Staphylococcus epidermidis TaxID=1282 RepID=UPI00164364B6|nr:hypothetical protein [Staphylococcus epidermidis]